MVDNELRLMSLSMRELEEWYDRYGMKCLIGALDVGPPMSYVDFK